MHKKQHENTQRRITRMPLHALVSKPLEVDPKEERAELREAINREQRRQARLKAAREISDDRLKSLSQRLKALSAHPQRQGALENAFMTAARKLLTREQWNEVMDKTHEELLLEENRYRGSVAVTVRTGPRLDNVGGERSALRDADPTARTGA